MPGQNRVDISRSGNLAISNDALNEFSAEIGGRETPKEEDQIGNRLQLF
jgi:hypothetical protein